MTFKTIALSRVSHEKTTIPKRVRELLKLENEDYITYEQNTETGKITINKS